MGTIFNIFWVLLSECPSKWIRSPVSKVIVLTVCQETLPPVLTLQLLVFHHKIQRMRSSDRIPAWGSEPERWRPRHQSTVVSPIVASYCECVKNHWWTFRPVSSSLLALKQRRLLHILSLWVLYSSHWYSSALAPCFHKFVVYSSHSIVPQTWIEILQRQRLGSLVHSRKNRKGDGDPSRLHGTRYNYWRLRGENRSWRMIERDTVQLFLLPSVPSLQLKLEWGWKSTLSSWINP